MDQVIFKYPGQKFVGIATRQTDGTLNHSAFALVNAIPCKGGTFADREVSELLTDEALLKERSLCALATIEAVAVLGKKT